MRGNTLSLEYQEERGVVKIFGGGVGMLCFVVKKEIRLGDSIIYESNDQGKCLGFEITKDEIELEEFHRRIAQFAGEKNIKIVE